MQWRKYLEINLDKIFDRELCSSGPRHMLDFDSNMKLWLELVCYKTRKGSNKTFHGPSDHKFKDCDHGLFSGVIEDLE